MMMNSNVSPHTNVTNEAKRASIDNLVGGYLKNVTPLGDGLFGVDNAPFFKMVTQLFLPTGFKNKYEMVAKIASHVGRSLVGEKEMTSDVYKRLSPQDQLILGELAATVLDYTNKTSFITPTRDAWRATYVPLTTPSTPAGSQYAEYRLEPANFTPDRICAMVASLKGLDLSRQEYKAISDQLAKSLLPLLRIVKASGDMDAYKLLLDLCNTVDSYFTLATTVASIASTAQLLTPIQDIVPLNPGSTLDIAPIVDLNLAPVMNSGVVNNTMDIVNIVNDITASIYNMLASVGIPVNNNIFNSFVQNAQMMTLKSVQFMSAITYNRQITPEMIDPVVISGLDIIASYGTLAGLPTVASIVLAIMCSNITQGNVNAANDMLSALGLSRVTPIANKPEFNAFQKAVYADYILGTDIFTRVASVTTNIPILNVVADKFIGPGKFLTSEMVFGYVQSVDNTATTIMPNDISNCILAIEPRLSISPDLVANLRDVLIVLFNNR